MNFFSVIFDAIDDFLFNLKNYIDFNIIFLVFFGLFLFTVICVIISTSHSYEARLIKAIDMFNNYFIESPQINEDNLVAFNNKMKGKKVPKQLRKQWQQYVLYREDKASHYMSFETCVSTPIKNSTFKRDINIMKCLAYVFAFLSLLINVYYSYETDFNNIIRHVLLCPIFILLLNYIIVIFLELRHNAIVSDLNQNYQYFEVNIDKATQTLPEYVDYEVLFDRNEIKKGIPILYAYLQKRAEEEQRELERARLKNVEHEKFNFDESGVESSLVLDRAMQEAENYIAERKKYLQDMDQIHNDMAQEDNSFRETTKEYRRQMQVSKETFDNFKTQLEEATSTIEINYLKKQQQQELDRQRNLERDYDTASEKHKKLISSYQEELSTAEGFIDEARNNLERAMMAEFSSYSSKVYDEANRVVEERQKDKFNLLKKEIKKLEENMHNKDAELDRLYQQIQSLKEQLEAKGEEVKFTEQPYVPAQPLGEVVDEIAQESSDKYSNEEINPYTEEKEEFTNNYQFEYESDQSDSYGSEDDNDSYSSENSYSQETSTQENDDLTFKPSSNYWEDDEEELQEEPLSNDDSDDDNEDEGGSYEPISNYWEDDEEDFNSSDEELDEDEDSFDEGETSNAKISTVQVESNKPKKKAGRPRKVVTEPVAPKRRVGRPKKENKEPEVKEVKRGRGRPKKVEAPVEVKRGRGRPRKVEAVVESESKKKPGRPKKTAEVVVPKKKAGRPKKEVAEPVAKKKPVGRPKKEDKPVEVKKGRGRPKKEVKPVETKKKGRGRPKKNSGEDEGVNQVKPDDIDAYLKEIDEQIAKENAKIKESARQIERKSRRIPKK